VKIAAVRARTRPVTLAAILVALVAVSFGSGYVAGSGRLVRSLHQPAAEAGSAAAGAAATPSNPDASPPPDVAPQFGVFWEAWNFVEKKFIRLPVDRTKLIQGAIKGLIGALNDPYGAYLDSAATRQEKANMDGVIEGIGASVEVKDKRYTIVAPLEDGPAAKAGLRTGDIVLKVDGKDVGTLSLAEAVALIRGPSGTKVRLTVQRFDDPDGAPVELELTRSRIELEAVTSRVPIEGIGYVRVRVFGTQTLPQLQRVLRDLRGRRVRGVILDLRDNPGGYLSSAVDVASQFLKEGSVVVYEEQDGKRTQSLARAGGLATDLTVAVLVNRGSASASEIVAGALRDHNRGVLIGETTFGKGSVQLPKDLSDGSSIRITVGTWLTPAGKTIQGQGLVPSIEAKPTPEDEKAKRDVALEKAIEWFGAAVASPTPGG
jgi:carboxyl-terminal processing protease